MSNETSETKTLDKSLLKSLMLEYVSSDEEIAAAKATLAALTAKQAKVVERMSDAGAKTFKFDGRNCTVVSRSSKKDPTKPATFFLKGYSVEDNSVEI